MRAQAGENATVSLGGGIIVPAGKRSWHHAPLRLACSTLGGALYVATSRVERLNQCLRNFQSSVTDIEASAVVSEDGLVIASSLPQGFDEQRVAAMSAAMLSIGTRASGELRRGEIEQLLLRGTQGYFVLMNGGAHAVLLALTRKDAKLGLIFYEMSRAADEVRSILV